MRGGESREKVVARGAVLAALTKLRGRRNERRRRGGGVVTLNELNRGVLSFVNFVTLASRRNRVQRAVPGVGKGGIARFQRISGLAARAARVTHRVAARVTMKVTAVALVHSPGRRARRTGKRKTIKSRGLLAKIIEGSQARKESNRTGNI